jgi:hypothetical protein
VCISGAGERENGDALLVARGIKIHRAHVGDFFTSPGPMPGRGLDKTSEYRYHFRGPDFPHVGKYCLGRGALRPMGAIALGNAPSGGVEDANRAGL